jgi:hypothetical protein
MVPGLWFGDWIGIPVAPDDLMWAGTLIGLFLVVGVSSYWVIASLRPALPGPLPLRPATRTLLVVLVCIGLVPYLLHAASASLSSVMEALGQGRGDKPWRHATAYVADPTNTFFWLCQGSLVAGGSLALLASLIPGRPTGRIITAAVAAVCAAIIFVDQGTRSLSASLLIPPVVTWMFHSSHRSPRRLVLLGSAAALSIAALSQLQLYLRTDHARSKLSTQSFAETLKLRQHNDFFTETAVAVSIVPRQRPYLRESPEWIFLTNPIPRFLWPGKPMPETFWVYSLYRWGRDVFTTGGNALPSVVGQYHMNWGWPGVLWVGALYGVSFALLDRMVDRWRPDPYLMLVPVAWMVYLFLAFRYFGPGFHYSALLLSCLWLSARQRPALPAHGAAPALPARRPTRARATRHCSSPRHVASHAN